MGASKTTELRLGIDLGGTKIYALVIDRSGKVVGASRTATKSERGYGQVIERIAETAEEALDDAGIRRKHIQVAGLGAPGPVDMQKGVIIFAPNLGWSNRPLAKDLSNELGLPVVLGNDVNMGALGEVTYGSARKAGSAIMAFVGTGLGGAFVVGGDVVNGAHGFGGEIGHIPSPFGDAICGCGARGCLETVASKTGLLRLVREAISRGKRAKLDVSGSVKSGAIAEALTAGCPVTREAVAQVAEALAWGLCTIGNTVDPEVYVLGGGLAETLGKPLLSQVAGRMAEISVLYRRHRPQLVMAQLGDDAVAIGAAVLAGRAVA